MSKTIKMIGVMCGAGIFAGCASTHHGMEMKVVPTVKVEHSHESAESYYSLGRYYHGARRFHEAMKAYERALELDPGYAKAHNAMGVLHAERGKYPHAIAVLREATRVAPNNSYFHSNLGYANYLNGDYIEAAASLEQATRLDPNNVRAWNNLGSVMEKLGRRDRSSMIFKRVQSVKDALLLAASTGKEVLRITKTRIEEAILNPSAKDSIGPYAFRTQPEADMRSRTELKQIGPSMYEVKQIAEISDQNDVTVTAQPPTITRQPAPATAPNISLRPVALRAGYTQAKLPLSSSTVRLEISNGNGINGMAKSVGKIIGDATLRVMRLTNQEQFNVKTTRVEYSEGHESTARVLAAAFGPAIDIKQNNKIIRSDIRVVLGRDLRNLESLRALFHKQLKVTKMGDDPRG